MIEMIAQDRVEKLRPREIMLQLFFIESGINFPQGFVK